MAAIPEFDTGSAPTGWQWYKSTYRGPMDALRNEKLGVVVKIFRYIGDPRTPLIVRVPTIKLDKDWVVQPIVEKKELVRAMHIINRKLKPYYKRGICPDIHINNVGWWCGKAVAFDW